VADFGFINAFLSVSRGLETAEPEELDFDDSQGKLDPWADDWLRGRGLRAQVELGEPNKRKRAPDDGDPGHEVADARAVETGVDLDRADLLTLARSQIGSPYVWADINPVGEAGGPGSGFDCSGFTQWVLSRFGIQTEHLSSAQQKQFRKVGREQLRPGDLVFYHYSDRNGPGDTADHVELYIGNGQTIGSSSGGVMVRDVNWDAFVGGGATGIDASEAVGGAGGTGRRAGPRRPKPRSEETAPFTLVNANLGDAPGFGAIMAAAMQSPTVREQSPPRGDPDRPRTGGSVKTQLRQGFIDSGRPDLAKMVATKDFDTWINAESGWRTDAVSQSFPGHGRNYGLFQFWEGHDWTDNFLNGTTTWTADAYTQAKLVTRYFPHLSPDDIRRYAQQVRAGEYRGWG
jgi:hypothetical protein